MITLLLLGYLEEEYVTTSYAINVYLVPGIQAVRLLRLSLDDVQGTAGPRIITSFLKEKRKQRGPGGKGKGSKTGDFVPPARPSKLSASTSKGRGGTEISTNDDSETSDADLPRWFAPKRSQETVQKRAAEGPKQRGASLSTKRKRVVNSEDEDKMDEGNMDKISDLEDFIVDNDEPLTANGSRDEHSVPNSADDDYREDWSFSFGSGSNFRESELSRPARKRPRRSRWSPAASIIELSD